ncbi:FecCD family ABC transporter permease [Synergistes jonesii]|uniref:Iron ABC transporter permease n=1 Tax=Synergistes jonesii TaxID=2754 RepID=A0A073IPZ7_9BACT|nr:iron ABC transporter permease [Synergistes jonesii]KEJ91511.1 iron ABC transporter permease [Synergistes jonesii]OFB60561.1 iron ABC transporter permease [Synergistes jonesii]OFB61317.1 iron ABC transporter permease [Synergistes jonesii]OFB64912.1 iron ABC transporter permease [Synergistes jonesii]OFB66738.1 iron ABC transporter permease [Synergistes jonesii]
MRERTAFALIAAALVVSPVTAVMAGRFPLSAHDTISALCPWLWSSEAPQVVRDVVLNIRLPRVLLAMLAGSGLGVAGGAFQALFSNPLATPDTLGVATGASFGAALGILLGLPSFGVQLCALASGLFAVALVMFVSRIRGSSSVIMMILAGMVTSALFSALVSLVKYAADPQDVLPAVTFWLMGSLSGTTRESVTLGAPLIVAGVTVIWLYRWRLNAMTLSEDEAVSLGVDVKRTRFAVIASAAAITASVVSMCGLIGWVGLLIPHASRMAFGNDNRRVVPASVAFGALFMLAIDTAARSLTASEIPASILTAVIGAPFFIFLLRKTGGIKA